MDGIIPKLRWIDKERLIDRLRRCGEAGLRSRYLVIVNLAEGRSPTQTAKALGMAKTTVYRVAGRFRKQGEVGLLDRREDNGERKLDEHYLAKLHDTVRRNPQENAEAKSTVCGPVGATVADLHAEVTRNHRCVSIEDLMKEVRAFLCRRTAQARPLHHHSVA